MKFVILTRPDCIWCVKAKKLMQSIGAEYLEENYDTEERRQYFKENIATTFPQIYTDNGEHIGGYMDFEAWVMQDIIQA